MTAWYLFSLALVIPLAGTAVAAGQGSCSGRCVAVQLLATLTTLVLIALSFALGQSFYIDLPLTLALLNLPAVLLMALFLERWL